MTRSDSTFAGAVPKIYAEKLVPMLFAPYAADLASRVAARGPRDVLEVAAGTGAVTRALAAALPPAASIVATDLNQPMLDQAGAAGSPRSVAWRQANALALPFDDGAFDAVACQFGVMFFPDRPRAFAEARRVLRPGGAYHFSTWDRIDESPLAETVQDAVAPLFPNDPPFFMERTPHGYHDPARIERDLADGGFTRRPRIEALTLRSRAASPRDVAEAFCLGTPLRDEITLRDASRLGAAVDAAEEAIARRFGRGPIDAGMAAFVIEVEKN